MRTFTKLLVLAGSLAWGGSLLAQSCTGLCTQQVACPNGGTTTITGVVYAPNGIDPLPHVQVYIPNAPVPAFTPGVSCPIAGALPSGSPLVGAVTAVDGSFILSNVPVGQNIPLVIVTGRWRRQLTIASTKACANTNLPDTFAVMPQNRTQGDIPKIAIATGSEDVVECGFAQIGIDPAEITDPAGGGRINLYGGGGAQGSGAVLDAATPTQGVLMSTPSLLNQYDVLMLPSEGFFNAKPADEETNLLAFADAGGRVFASNTSDTWMIGQPPFSTAASWAPGQAEPVGKVGEATIDTSFADGETLAQWLPIVDDGGVPGLIPIISPYDDFTSLTQPASTQVWFNVFTSIPFGFVESVGQLTFDTPIAPSGSGVNQCGRVLFDAYDVVVAEERLPQGTTYPNECPQEPNTPVSPQQKLLEFNLFELTNDGGFPSISPVSWDFSTEAFGYSSAPQVFTWTNNSKVSETVTSVSIRGAAFNVVAGSDTCTGTAVAGGGTCKVLVVFTPSAVGPLAGTLSVLSQGFTVSALLSGTGTPTFTLAPTSLQFGGVAVGGSTSLPVTLTSNATQPLPLPVMTTTAGYTVSTSGCSNPVPPLGVCTATVTFSPTTVASVSGAESGTLEVETSPEPQRTLLYGYGIADFTLTPATLDFGSQAIGSSTTQTLTLTSVANKALATPVFTVTGNYYSVSTTACGATMKAGATCPVAVTFTPHDAGVFAGTLTDTSTNVVYGGLNASFTGTSGDFSVSFSPNSGSVIAGEAAAINLTITELAGRDPHLVLTCALPAAATATSCSFAPPTGSGSSLNTTVYVATVSEYKVIGYTGFGGTRGLWLIGLGTGCLVWIARRRVRPVLRGSLWLIALATMGLSLTACSGLLPAKNASYTAPGTYAVTVTATDNQLVHSATYSLTVNAK